MGEFKKKTQLRLRKSSPERSTKRLKSRSARWGQSNLWEVGGNYRDRIGNGALRNVKVKNSLDTRTDLVNLKVAIMLFKKGGREKNRALWASQPDIRSSWTLAECLQLKC
ncbi:hypothetical protein scyTo_0005065 [Scyliorhinus torazame]|uniref:Uncharacterized protein n=1 Tax=Scyliorhinus torazame TaxID=75743 RepID=A0A401P1J5_SCYTO|nr:hypothetical protein [Scyliorhinus torazame]